MPLNRAMKQMDKFDQKFKIEKRVHLIKMIEKENSIKQKTSKSTQTSQDC